MGLKAEITAIWAAISLVLALQGWASDMARYGPEFGSWIWILRTTLVSSVVSAAWAYARQWVKDTLGISL